LTSLESLPPSQLGENLDCYKSITDLPIKNWWDYNETRDLGYLLKTYKQITESEIEKLSIVYHGIMNEFSAEFGVDEDLKDILEQQIRIAMMKVAYMDGDDGQLTMIELAEIDLKEQTKMVNGMSFYEVKAILEKNMGFRIDPLVTTVMEYYSYIRLYGKKGK